MTPAEKALAVRALSVEVQTFHEEMRRRAEDLGLTYTGGMPIVGKLPLDVFAELDLHRTSIQRAWGAGSPGEQEYAMAWLRTDMKGLAVSTVSWPNPDYAPPPAAAPDSWRARSRYQPATPDPPPSTEGG